MSIEPEPPAPPEEPPMFALPPLSAPKYAAPAAPGAFRGAAPPAPPAPPAADVAPVKVVVPPVPPPPFPPGAEAPAPIAYVIEAPGVVDTMELTIEPLPPGEEKAFDDPTYPDEPPPPLRVTFKEVTPAGTV